MAIKWANAHNSNVTYVGLSTDTKPVNSDTGALLYTTDDGVTYIYNGSTWSDYTGAGGSGSSSLTYALEQW